MATLYVIEPCEKEGCHIHAYFIFYGSPPFAGDRERNRQLFGRHVFKLWNHINGGSLCRIANKTTAYNNLDPTYFIKQLVAMPRGKRKQRDSANWWGIRNKRLLKENEVPLDATLFEETMSKVKHNESKAIEEGRSASEVEKNWKPDPLYEWQPSIWPKHRREEFLTEEIPWREMSTSDILKLLVAG